MSVTILTPVTTAPAVELAEKTWRKKILPVGWLDYEGRKINFTPEYLANVVAGFKAKAFGGVPFQLADEKNAHTNDPERTRGQITDVELGADETGPGLFANIRTGDKGSELLRENPNLGVSVRIVEDHEHNDGSGPKRFPAALQHVLGTWAPRLEGMGGWKAVTCSQESEHTLDFSTLDFVSAPAASDTPPPGPGGNNPGKDGQTMAELTPEEKAQLAAILAKLGGDGGAAPAAPTAPTGAAPAGPTQPVETPAPAAATPPAPVVTPPVAAPAAPTTVASVNSMFTPEELAAMTAAAAAPTEVAAHPQLVGSGVSAATVPAPANTVDLTVLQAQRDADAVELAHVRNELAEARWQREFTDLVTKLGLPPHIVTLAQPMLRGTGNAVELAHGAPTEPIRQQMELGGRITRELLAAVAKFYGPLIDMSSPIGSAVDVTATEAETTARNEFMARARAAGFGH